MTFNISTAIIYTYTHITLIELKNKETDLSGKIQKLFS